MPILSMFYGIVIRMYFNDDRQHHVPTCMRTMPDSERYSTSPMGSCWQGNYRRARPDW